MKTTFLYLGTATLVAVLMAPGGGAQQTPAAKQAPTKQAPGKQAAVPGEPAKPGRVSGIVLSTTGEPVARAQVTLSSGMGGILAAAMSAQAGRGGNGADPAAALALLGGGGGGYEATTDDVGKFVLEDVEPRRGYMLQASKTGYVPARYGARSQAAIGALLNVEPGQEMLNLKLTIEQQGAVSGRVVDNNGDPLSGATVILQRRAYQNGVRTLQPAATAQTDDRGVYRIAAIPSGRYFLRASPPNPPAGMKEVPLPTYYPNVLDSRRASPIDMAAGADMKNLEVRVQQGAVFTVTGKVMDGAAPAATALVLPAAQGADVASEMTSIMANIQQRLSRPDGTFTLGNMPAGAYDVMVIDIAGLAASMGAGRGGAGGGGAAGGRGGAGGGGINMRLGIGTFYVTNQDVKDVVLTIGSGASVSGAAKLEGGDVADILPKGEGPQGLLEQLVGAQISAGTPPEVAEMLGGGNLPVSVGLTGATASLLRGVPAGSLNPDGTFLIESVPPGNYQVSLGALPPDVYAKSIKFNDKDALANGVDIGVSGTGNLQVVLARGAATVSVSVKNAKDEPEVGVPVVLWTELKQIGAANHGVRSATTGRDGVAKFTSLAPGTYYAAAFENVEPTLVLVRDFVTKLQADATKVELTEGATVTQDVKMIPAAKSTKAEDELE